MSSTTCTEPLLTSKTILYPLFLYWCINFFSFLMYTHYTQSSRRDTIPSYSLLNIYSENPFCLFICILATLISNRARCLACWLAGCLALAAAALLYRLFIVPGRQCFNMLHTYCLLKSYSPKVISIYDSISHISTFEKYFFFILKNLKILHNFLQICCIGI